MLIDEGMDAITEAIEREADQHGDAEERQADQFALAMLRNGRLTLPLDNHGTMSAAQLVNMAMSLGDSLSVDPGHIILSYARDHDDWLLANQALGYFPDQANAKELLKDRFLANCDVDRLTDDNRAYLLSMQGF